MQPEVRDKLLRINRAFYQSLALPFAATRSRPQPGVVRILGAIEPDADVLDLGCGHGLAAQQLARNGHVGAYRGIDASEELIGLARLRVAEPWATFSVADLAREGWLHDAERPAFDWVLAFAVLHHLPDAELRLRMAQSIHGALRNGGRAALSAWDFARHERFRRRVVGWEVVGLTAEEVEPGDALLDWRQGGRGLRYVHHFSSGELEALGRAAGMQLDGEFRSDGRGGKLGLYQIWKK